MSQTTFLADYLPPAFLIEKTDLVFELEEDFTIVTSKLQIIRNLDPNAPQNDFLELNGEELELLELRIDANEVEAARYSVSDDLLRIDDVCDQFVLETRCKIYPQNNTSLSGLYKSRGMFCTQCEAEGFRRITWYVDRPDVLSLFTTTIVANANVYPVLLSNGNKISDQLLEDGRRQVVWEDPFLKPSYLFALVGGNLSVLDDSFVTRSGREVAIQIFVEPKDLDKCGHALRSLKSAMRWDEEVYGREYDLDIFMIVAVDDFNMGAMENKGLNIFNTSAVLASPETTTDARFQWVEGVVAHEYFHNWSGNRVTCRDWFQLSLKEGFTVFRDSEFSADMNSRAVKRIEDVKTLRTYQFAEDGGPLAHPVQPSSYMEINNFYTLTIYEKGAEVVRMISQFLGPELFRKGSDLYFERHDGQAVTIEDFVAAMSDVSGFDFSQFMNWYRQAGTPVVKMNGSYDSSTKEFRLTAIQSCPATPECEDKQPFQIPIKTSLIGRNGPVDFALDGSAHESFQETVLELKQDQQEFLFKCVEEEPVPSLLRDFSAPVKLEYDCTKEQLAFLVKNDDNGFVRWDACQTLTIQLLQKLQADWMDGNQLQLDACLDDLFRGLLTSTNAHNDNAIIALLLLLPAEDSLALQSDIVQVDAIHRTREFVRASLAKTHAEMFKRLYLDLNVPQTYEPSAKQIADRALKNCALAYWLTSEDQGARTACVEQFNNADNMTDQLAAMHALVNHEPSSKQAETALSSFYDQWKDEQNVINQWFAIQSSSHVKGNIEAIKSLMDHEAFDMRNPNKVRSVIGAFAGQNPIHFHMLDGSGYEFLGDQIIALNEINPQIGSRMMTPLTKWRRHIPERSKKMKAQLDRILKISNISSDIEEIAVKALA